MFKHFNTIAKTECFKLVDEPFNFLFKKKKKKEEEEEEGRITRSRVTDLQDYQHFYSTKQFILPAHSFEDNSIKAISEAGLYTTTKLQIPPTTPTPPPHPSPKKKKKKEDKSIRRTNILHGSVHVAIF